MTTETNARTKCAVILSIAALAAVLSQSLWAQSVTHKNFTVRVLPKPDGSVVVDTGPQGVGAAGKGRGYMGYGEDQAGWATFQVRGQNPYTTCADDDGKGPSPWVITRVDLSDTGVDLPGKPPGTTEQKGTEFGTPVATYVSQSFPGVDPDTGLLVEVGKDAAKSFLQVYNYNAHMADGTTKRIYYRVQVTRCRDGYAADADPTWGNDGRR
jgi:hypothetical protein